MFPKSPCSHNDTVRKIVIWFCVQKQEDKKKIWKSCSMYKWCTCCVWRTTIVRHTTNTQCTLFVHTFVTTTGNLSSFELSIVVSLCFKQWWNMNNMIKKKKNNTGNLYNGSRWTEENRCLIEEWRTLSSKVSNFDCEWNILHTISRRTKWQSGPIPINSIVSCWWYAEWFYCIVHGLGPSG